MRLPPNRIEGAGIEPYDPRAVYQAGHAKELAHIAALDMPGEKGATR